MRKGTMTLTMIIVCVIVDLIGIISLFNPSIILFRIYTDSIYLSIAVIIFTFISLAVLNLTLVGVTVAKNITSAIQICSAVVVYFLAQTVLSIVSSIFMYSAVMYMIISLLLLAIGVLSVMSVFSRSKTAATWGAPRGRAREQKTYQLSQHESLEDEDRRN